MFFIETSAKTAENINPLFEVKKVGKQQKGLIMHELSVA
jgi:hypothetical protein